MGKAAPTVRTAAAADPVLEFQRVGKIFKDGTQALAEVSLDITRGEFVAIVGPSGCGKSTLLRLASGLSRCSRGRIETHCASLGYVFQDPTLLPWRTVAANIELPMQLAGLDRSERTQRTRSVIQLVGLEGFEKHYPRALSGGMAMRTSLARALTLRPDLFLFDEPFGAIDAITRERLNEELLRIYTLEGFTGVFVTHSITEAVYLSSRVVVMCGRPGRVVTEYPIPFGYPRKSDLRYEPKFNSIALQVSEALREASR